MYISDLVDYCHSKYHRSHQCPACSNNCPNSCECCLDDIHFQRVQRRYDCDNMTRYYVCKYIYKYSSEIDYILAQVNAVHAIPDFKILSIGCGPCTDLFGVANHILRFNNGKHITYRGFDLNTAWIPIHHEISRLAGLNPNNNVQFKYTDVFNYFAAFEDRVPEAEYNMLFLQYVISDMIANGYDPNDFYDQLISKIIINMPKGSVIIINDINLMNNARDTFWPFVYKLYAKGINATPQNFHFVNNNKPYYRFGNQHTNNGVLTIPPPIIQNQYNPWTFCSSAQIAITKES
jgi:hypothetical protein